MIGISLLYVLFVTVIGPTIMKKRDPFDLRFWILHYNSILIGVNGIGTVICLWITNWGLDTWNCSKHKPDVNDPKETLMIYLGFMFVITKFFDFMDTIFFVLRKKYNQVTFLHIFHHGKWLFYQMILCRKLIFNFNSFNRYHAFRVLSRIKIPSSFLLWFYAFNQCMYF